MSLLALRLALADQTPFGLVYVYVIREFYKHAGGMKGVGSGMDIMYKANADMIVRKSETGP